METFEGCRRWALVMVSQEKITLVSVLLSSSGGTVEERMCIGSRGNQKENGLPAFLALLNAHSHSL